MVKINIEWLDREWLGGLDDVIRDIVGGVLVEGVIHVKSQ